MKQKKQKTEEQSVIYHKSEIFTIVEKTNEKQKTFILTLGNYKIKEFETRELAELYIQDRTWELLFAVINIVNEFQTKIKEEQK